MNDSYDVPIWANIFIICVVITLLLITHYEYFNLITLFKDICRGISKLFLKCLIKLQQKTNNNQN